MRSLSSDLLPFWTRRFGLLAVSCGLLAGGSASFVKPLWAHGAADDEGPADVRKVRNYRERLAEPSVAATQDVVKEMMAEPHPRWCLLILESLVREVRRVEQARMLLPESQARVVELRKELSTAQQRKIPSAVKRLQAELADAGAEVADHQNAVRGKLLLESMLQKGFSQVSRSLTADGRSSLVDDLGGKLRSMHKVEDRAVLLRVFGLVDHPRSSLLLMRIVRDPVEKPDSVLVALQSLGRLALADALPAAIGALEHKDWRVQSEAVETIRMMHRRSSIPFLIQHLDGRVGRLRDDIGRALNSLTGQNFAPDHEHWRRWWADNRNVLQMPAKPVAKDKSPVNVTGGTHFYGIQSYSRRVLFVLDVSGSMNEPARSYGNSKGTRNRKIDEARKNLRAAVQSLHPEANFNVLLYSDSVQRAFPDVVQATAENKARAITFADTRDPGGGTNIYAGLVDAFELAEPARRNSRRGEKEPEVDTIYFLSDGQPTSGVVRRPSLILADVAARNRLRRLRIHAVGVGSHDKNFMRELAAQNGGSYIAR